MTTPRDDIAGLLNDIEDRRSHPAYPHHLDELFDEAATQLDSLLKERDALQAERDELRMQFDYAMQEFKIRNDELKDAEARAAALQAEANPTPQDYLKMSRMWANEKARATRLQQERDSLKVDCSAYASRNTNLRNDLVLAGMARDAAQQERDEAYERAATIAKDRAVKLRAKAKSLKQPHSQHYFAQAIEASVIETAIRRLAGPEKEKTE